jgi:hypothetical protein
MNLIITGVLFSLALCGLAWLANVRFRREDRLPMQWWLTREVTWSAPRPLALAFIPALAFAVFASLIILSRNVAPRAGQEGMVLPTFIGIGAMFVFIQILLFWLIGRTLLKNDG